MRLCRLYSHLIVGYHCKFIMVPKYSILHLNTIRDKYIQSFMRYLPLVGSSTIVKWSNIGIGNKTGIERNVSSNNESLDSTEKLVTVLNSMITNKYIVSESEFLPVLKTVEKASLSTVFKEAEEDDFNHRKISQLWSIKGCTDEHGILLLQCCGELFPDISLDKRAELTLTTWNVLKKSGQISLHHYHLLLESLAASQYKIRVDSILNEMHDLKLVPTEETYLRMLQCLSEVGNIQETVKLIDLMKESGIPLNHRAFDYIILGHARSRDMKSAIEVLEVMQSISIQPTSTTYMRILQGAAEMKNEKLFLKYFNDHKGSFTDLQRLEITKSLAIGQLTKLIPQVLEGGTWPIKLKNNVAITCLNMITLGCIDAAYFVVKHLPRCVPVSPTSEASYAWFFIYGIVKSGAPAEKIFEICKNLEDLNPYALLKALEAALICGLDSVALQLLKALSEEGIMLRPHYFWPLIMTSAKKSGEAGVLNVLDTMLHYKVTPDYETLNKYICNLCDLHNPVQLVKKLQDRGLPVSAILTPLLATLISNSNLKDAIDICKKYKSNIKWEKLISPLTQEYFKTGKLSSVVEILKYIEEDSVADDLIGESLNYLRLPHSHDGFFTLVEGLKAAGFKLSLESSDTVNRIINGRRINGFNAGLLHPKDMNTIELESHLLELKSKGMNTRGLLRKLLQKHSSEKNVTRVIEIKKELEEKGCDFSAGMLCSLLDTFINLNHLVEAENILKEIKEKHPDFNLDHYKIVDLATLYIKSNQYSNAVKLLTGEKGVKPCSSFQRNCFALLNAAAEFEGPEKTKELYDLLISKNYCVPSNVLMGPRVRAYLHRKDLVGAVNEFEKCALSKRCTPLQHELLTVLISEISSNSDTFEIKRDQSEVADNDQLSLLQKVIKVGTLVHGEDNTNVAVLVALSECGKTKQLDKFVRDPSFRVNIGVLVTRCKRLADENKPDTIRRIIKAIQHIKTVKIETLFQIMLDVYVRQGDCDGAISLWTELQEADATISESFLKNLTQFLESNKKQIPFAISSSKSKIKVEEKHDKNTFVY